MGLKMYKIDTSPLDPEDQEKAMRFIETNAYNNQYVPHSKGCYYCTWEETVNPSAFPALCGCVIHEVPSASMF